MSKITQVLVISAIFIIDIARSQDKCAVSNDDKVDCGISGTQQPECEGKGCCWQPVNPNPTNLPW